MKQSITKGGKQSGKASLVGYILAALLAIQPMLDASVDFSKREAVMKYSLKLMVAVAVAVLGKYAANHLHTVNRNTGNHA